MAIRIVTKNVNDRQILRISATFHFFGGGGVTDSETDFLDPELVDDRDLFLLYLKAEPAKSVLKSKSCLRGLI